MRIENYVLRPEYSALREIIEHTLDFGAEISRRDKPAQKEAVIGAFQSDQLRIEQAQALYNHLNLKSV